jgi:dsRNA-specific ribonuclease
MPALYAAQYAYVGPATLASMSRDWGVEVVAAPGPEVDPGLLQLKRQAAGNAMGPDNMHRLKDMPQQRKSIRDSWNRPGSSRTNIYGDQFGGILENIDDAPPYPGAPISSSSSSADAESNDTPANDDSATSLLSPQDTSASTVESASAGFVRALTGALYLHAGSSASKSFHSAHVLSRHLAIHQLFNFTHPTRDLSRLCLREGFEPPVARLISETGRLSRTPVFVVGVFSGDDKLGEGAGSSLNEARVRASAHALRCWYLYSPPDAKLVLPSDVENGADGAKWRPHMVDPGEIIT